MTCQATSLPPGPRLPGWAQALALAVARRRVTDAWRARHGADALTLRTLSGDAVVTLFDPGLVEAVFRAPPDRLVKGEINAPLARVFGRGALLMLDGAEHLHRRRLMLPAFHGERLRVHETLMREAADREIDSWPVGEPFALLDSMQALTMTVILRAVFGVVGAREEAFARGIRALFRPPESRRERIRATLTGGRFGAAARRRLAATVTRLDELIYAEIAERRTAPDLEARDDVCSMLLRARDQADRLLTAQEVRSELMTLLLAGHAATAASLTWALEQLLRAPAVLSRLAAELAAGDEEYLDAVVREALRVRTAIPDAGRVVGDRPFELGDHLLAPGTRIAIEIEAIHRRADLHADPTGFRPQRFLGAEASNGRAWLPFGGGTRRCLGASFALLQMRVTVRRVVERTTLVAARDRPDRPSLQRLTARRGITVIPRDGVRVVQPRLPRPAAEGAADAQRNVLPSPR